MKSREPFIFERVFENIYIIYNDSYRTSGAKTYGDAMDAARAASVAATPLGHAGSPQDVAASIRFLASEESRFVTGTELVIDGGVMAG